MGNPDEHIDALPVATASARGWSPVYNARTVIVGRTMVEEARASAVLAPPEHYPNMRVTHGDGIG